MSEVRLAVEQRTEFGKGAARRTRRAGKIPAVLYGHGEDPRHLSLPAIDFARVLRENGNNAVLTLNVGGGRELALTKTVTVHPLKNYIEHVDLLVVKRGEKVTVDVPVTVSGESATGTMVYQEMDTISVEAEALHIPEQFEVSVEEAEVGTQFQAADISLPRGVELATDPESLVVNVAAMPAAEEEDTEEGGEPAEGEAAVESSDES